MQTMKISRFIPFPTFSFHARHRRWFYSYNTRLLGNMSSATWHSLYYLVVKSHAILVHMFRNVIG